MNNEVCQAIREVGTAEVVARFRALEAGEIDEKSPGDYVTIADRECERVLGGRLRQIRDIPVVGEEAVSADPGLLNSIEGSPAAWVVDPVDGTANFVSGSTDFAVMVALVEAGLPTAAWVWMPIEDIMYRATLGGGAYRDDTLLRIDAPDDLDEPRPLGSGIVKSKYVPEPGRTKIRETTSEWPLSPDRGCAGVEYALLAEGKIDFLWYWRTMPWDHSPGTLIATEAGLVAQRLDGSPYRPGQDHRGLLTAVPSYWSALATPLAEVEHT